MTTHQTFQAHLTSWKHAVAGNPHDPLPVEVVAEDLEQFQEWAKILAQVKIQANKAGFLCEFNKGGSSRKAAWIKSGPYTLKVVFTTGAKPTMNKGVADSSIEKYHELDTRGQVLKVAIAAASLTQKHGFTTDSQVAEFVGIPSARVSARRTEIERLQGVVIMGTPHYFETAGRVKCPVTGNSVNGWRVVAAGQAELFG